MKRSGSRKKDALRAVKIETGVNMHAEGSVLISMGNTKVICTASVEEKVPPFKRNTGQGWVTAEYSMLPRATSTRSTREASRGRQGGRTMEIQRLIGRALRSVVKFDELGERTVWIDCDVIQADGGTRTASITGGFVALADALQSLQDDNKLAASPLTGRVASVSVGIYKGTPVLDLDYPEDCNAETDMNVVMNDHGDFIEVQGTAEGHAFSQDELNSMLTLAKKGIEELLASQQAALET